MTSAMRMVVSLLVVLGAGVVACRDRLGHGAGLDAGQKYPSELEALHAVHRRQTHTGARGGRLGVLLDDDRRYPCIF